MLFLEFTEHWKMEHREKRKSFCKDREKCLFDMKLKVIMYELLSFFLRFIFARCSVEKKSQ